ncbi:hypothetical protein OB2597_10481 [Pseudooceanicola batsensis HTCC2597]|uniref:Lipoprotein n=1 Tax=Pseudooceanicola batsensis (strain ATCC BAA-863 / DSM 15984 / KCTC 12145 / HTCC2597) TaxID=252305 RepID=A3TVL6_PSEBH|nr:hypothetical protein [Pseudooceanicola batsensis]EAQ03662.1 hypothetical protein OB2597_10481 [Pseudooceanicola batsensis HTCC2597]
MTRFIALMLSVAMLAGPAYALSCLRPDVATAYTRAAEAEDGYLVVRGTLSHDRLADEGTMRSPDQADGPPETFEATIEGRFLRGDAFAGEIAAPVTVVLECVSVWCAAPPPAGAEVLAFVRQTETTLFLETGPCGGTIFVDPGEDQIDRVLACHSGGDCAPD